MQLLMRIIGPVRALISDVWVDNKAKRVLILAREASAATQVRRALKTHNLSYTTSVETLDDAWQKGMLLGYAVGAESLLSTKTPLQQLGGTAKAIVTYDLSGLDHVRKTQFGYALKGRGSQKGVLQKLKGSTLGRNSVIINAQHLGELEEFMRYWKARTTTQTLIEAKR